MGDDRTDIEQKEMEVFSRAAIGVQPVLREAAEVMQRLARDTDPKLYGNWLDWLVLQKLPPIDIPPPPETDPTRAAAPAAHKGPPDDDSPEARRAKRR